MGNKHFAIIGFCFFGQVFTNYIWDISYSQLFDPVQNSEKTLDEKIGNFVLNYRLMYINNTKIQNTKSRTELSAQDDFYWFSSFLLIYVPSI